MFGKKQIQIIEQPKLLGIEDLTEQADFNSAIRLLPKFNLKHIPDNFMYKDRLVLKEQITEDEDGVIHRRDYVITPKRGIKILSGNRMAIDADISLRFDGILGYLNNQGNTRNFIFGENADIRRYLVEDGNEIYTYNGIEILEAKADICKKCKDCHERAPTLNLRWSVSNGDYDTVKYNNNYQRTIRDVREYKINPPLLGLLFGTGVHISEVNHPCQWKNLHELLNSNYEVADPPEIKIVFPKQE